VRSPYVDLKKKQDELVSRKRRNKGGGAPLSEEEERIASAAPYPSVWDDAAETSEWKEITRWNSSDLFIPVSTAGHAYAFARKGRSVLVLTSANASAVRLVQLSASTGKLEKVLAAGEKGKGEFCFCFFLLSCASVVELPRSLHARSLAPVLQPLETAQRGTFISSAAKAQEKNKNRKISPPLLSPSLSPPLITRPLFLSSKINKTKRRGRRRHRLRRRLGRARRLRHRAPAPQVANHRQGLGPRRGFGEQGPQRLRRVLGGLEGQRQLARDPAVCLGHAATNLLSPGPEGQEEQDSDEADHGE